MNGPPREHLNIVVAIVHLTGTVGITLKTSAPTIKLHLGSQKLVCCTFLRQFLQPRSPIPDLSSRLITDPTIHPRDDCSERT